MAKLTSHVQWTKFITSSTDKYYSLDSLETSVTNNNSFQNYPHLDGHTIRTTDTPGFKPFTTWQHPFHIGNNHLSTHKVPKQPLNNSQIFNGRQMVKTKPQIWSVLHVIGLNFCFVHIFWSCYIWKFCNKHKNVATPKKTQCHLVSYYTNSSLIYFTSNCSLITLISTSSFCCSNSRLTDLRKKS